VIGKERREVRFDMGIWQEVLFVMPVLEPKSCKHGKKNKIDAVLIDVRCLLGDGE
jgi:hypothetical protein